MKLPAAPEKHLQIHELLTVDPQSHLIIWGIALSVMKLSIRKIKFELSGSTMQNTDANIISVFCWTPHHNRSQQIVNEVFKAIFKKREVIEILKLFLETCKFDSVLSSPFSQFHFLLYFLVSVISLPFVHNKMFWHFGLEQNLISKGPNCSVWDGTISVLYDFFLGISFSLAATVPS